MSDPVADRSPVGRSHLPEAKADPDPGSASAPSGSVPSGPVPSGPAPSDPVPSGSVPSGPVPSGPAPSDPAPPALILIRHGETEWSRSGQHTGRTDLELTAVGREQARRSGVMVRRLLNSHPPAAVLSSPRRRALHTAELAGFAVSDLDPDAAEWDYGDYEGLTSAQIHRIDPSWSIWDGKVPQGESAEMIQARIDRLLQRVRGLLGSGTVLIFSHGHASRCIAARWLGESVREGRKYRLGTGAVSSLDFEHGYPAILHWNLDEVVQGPDTTA